MLYDNKNFFKITGLDDKHAEIVHSQLASIVKYHVQDEPIKARRLLDQSLGIWNRMGEGGQIVIREAASVLACVGMVEEAERVAQDTKEPPLRINALLGMVQNIMNAKFYKEEGGCSIVEMLTRLGPDARYGQDGRAAVVDRLSSSTIAWPLGIDEMLGKNPEMSRNSCAAALDIYWSNAITNRHLSRNRIDDASMKDVVGFVKSLARNGSDPMAGLISALAMSIPPERIDNPEKSLWVFEQISQLGWANDVAIEQTWCRAVREDVARVYRPNHKFGARFKAMERMGFSIPPLSNDCRRRYSLKVVAMDTACIKLIERIKKEGRDVDWRGPGGDEGFFSLSLPLSADAWKRTLAAAEGMAISFTREDIAKQASCVNVAGVDYMLKRDPSMVFTGNHRHPLSDIAVYADNEKNHDSICDLIRLFAENARYNNKKIQVDEKIIKLTLRARATKALYQHRDAFDIDDAMASRVQAKICSHPVEWDTEQSKSLIDLFRYLSDNGATLAAGKKRRAGMVAKAMQSRNPRLACALLEMGAGVDGITIADCLPKNVNEKDRDHTQEIHRAMVLLARCGVPMGNVSGSGSHWINPVIAAAQKEWMESSVDQAKPRDAGQVRAPRF